MRLLGFSLYTTGKKYGIDAGLNGCSNENC